jgi:hypothetical protein
MAALLRENPRLITEVLIHQVQDIELNLAMQKFLEDFEDLFCGASSCSQDMPTLGELLAEMASRPPRPERFDVRDVAELRERFLSNFSGKKGTEAEELLELSRASYRLRNDDNLHLGRIEAQLHRATAEVERRGARLARQSGSACPGMFRMFWRNCKKNPQRSPWGPNT